MTVFLRQGICFQKDGSMLVAFHFRNALFQIEIYIKFVGLWELNVKQETDNKNNIENAGQVDIVTV